MTSVVSRVGSQVVGKLNWKKQVIVSEVLFKTLIVL